MVEGSPSWDGDFFCHATKQFYSARLIEKDFYYLESENGIKSAFRKAKLQGCKVVVLDFDMHMSESILKTKKIVSGLFGRHEDFTEGELDECYIVHNRKAVVVKSDAFTAPDKETIKQIINDVIEKLRT